MDSPPPLRPSSSSSSSSRIFQTLLTPALRRIREQAIAQTPLEFQLLGKTLLHAALVGLAAGLMGSLFVAGLDALQALLLEGLAGYDPLKAAGEHELMRVVEAPYRPWLLCLLPALGALGAGVLSLLAPEIRGGGSNALILSFHQHDAVIRRRVLPLKALASLLTLGTGGAGGREGPTMQLGGALGSIVGRLLNVTPRERRLLLVAGAAAGMAAVFRTPLGAALLAVEVLHRDDFESDALVPAVLGSVVSYSVFISIFGEGTLFAHSARYPFIPTHLPLYILMAVLVCLGAVVFIQTLRAVEHYTARSRLPVWLKPAVGGLLLGIGTVLMLQVMEPYVGRGQGMGILGGGYGLAQVAITGAAWLPQGWSGVYLLLLLAAIKILATSLTVGTGGSAGDFGPSLVLGGLLGGAFGRAAQLLLSDPAIDSGAFALVGMGTFYGGLAHVPIGALVMVCELTGSYDLLVPLMLCEGVAFLALRKHTLYPAQRDTQRDSPAHRDDWVFDVLQETRVGEVIERGRAHVSFRPNTPARQLLHDMAHSAWQDAFPVLGPKDQLIGVVYSELLRTFTAEPGLQDFTIALDLMHPPLFVDEETDLHTALERLLEHNLRELLVVDKLGKVIGFLDEADITRVYHMETRMEPEPEAAAVEESAEAEPESVPELETATPAASDISIEPVADPASEAVLAGTPPPAPLPPAPANPESVPPES